MVKVVDPTLLIERQYYEKLAGPRKNCDKLLFSYILHGMDPDAENVRSQITKGLRLKALNCDTRKTKVHRGYLLPSPPVWLQHIRDASFMLTNSFHGIVFCLIFHTPFVAILLEGESSSMNNRICELLKAVGLGRRIASPRQTVSDELLGEEIDWCNVERHLHSMISDSLYYFDKQQI